VDPNVFETANAGFAQALYEDYLLDPETVPAEWRALFESGRGGEPPPAIAANCASKCNGAPPAAEAPPAP
jgi:2-oxoglutarate dehydrogenase complex dehydrogenase (E1) component-like enzyme